MTVLQLAKGKTDQPQLQPPAIAQNAPKLAQDKPKLVAGIRGGAEQLGLSERQCGRLAVQRLLPGGFRGRWKVKRTEFWLGTKAAKSRL